MVLMWIADDRCIYIHGPCFLLSESVSGVLAQPIIGMQDHRGVSLLHTWHACGSSGFDGTVLLHRRRPPAWFCAHDPVRRLFWHLGLARKSYIHGQTKILPVL